MSASHDRALIAAAEVRSTSGSHPKAPSTGLVKRKHVPSTFSLQTRSMSKVQQSNARLDNMKLEGQTVFSGVRRKRAPLMDALVNAGRSADDDERPRKMAKPSKPSPPQITRRPSLKARTSLAQPPVPSSPAPTTPVRLLGTQFLPESARSHHSDSSSEDSLMLKPTPRKTPAGESRLTNMDWEGDQRDMTKRTARLLFPAPAKEGVLTEDSVSPSRQALQSSAKTFTFAEPLSPKVVMPSSETATRPRVVDTVNNAQRTTTLPRSATTSSFAAPTQASLMRQAATRPIAAATSGIKRPASSVLSGAASSTLPRKRPNVSASASSSSLKASTNRLSMSRTATPRNLADIVESETADRDDDVEMRDDAKTRSTDRDRLASRQRAALSASTSARPPTLAGRPATTARLPQPSHHTLSSKSSAPPSLPSGTISTARKPSYPAGLGSGPLAKPVARVVSNPLIQRQSDRIDGILAGTSAVNRSVSDPLASSATVSRPSRVGLNTKDSDTSRSLYGLSAALARLQVKKSQANAASAPEATSIASTGPIDGSAGGWSFAVPVSIPAAPLQDVPATPGKWVTAARSTKTPGTGSDSKDIRARQAFSIEHAHSTALQKASGIGPIAGGPRQRPAGAAGRESLSSKELRARQAFSIEHAHSTALQKAAGIVPTGGGVQDIHIGPGRDSVAGAREDNSGDLSFADSSGNFCNGPLNTTYAALADIKCFRGVTAFVDVRTSEGDDSSALFSDVLRACGAKVLQKPSESVTHVIFKSGRTSTLHWLHKQPEERRPFVVGVTWIAKCKEAGHKVDEKAYEVDYKKEAVFQRRRKSMEPKQLAAMMAGDCDSTSQVDVQNPLVSIAQARRRTMQFARGFRRGYCSGDTLTLAFPSPARIGSPLKKAYRPSLTLRRASPSDEE